MQSAVPLALAEPEQRVLSAIEHRQFVARRVCPPRRPPRSMPPASSSWPSWRRCGGGRLPSPVPDAESATILASSAMVVCMSFTATASCATDDSKLPTRSLAEAMEED
jgi:hypothetical protein